MPIQKTIAIKDKLWKTGGLNKGDSSIFLFQWIQECAITKITTTFAHFEDFI